MHTRYDVSGFMRFLGRGYGRAASPYLPDPGLALFGRICPPPLEGPPVDSPPPSAIWDIRRFYRTQESAQSPDLFNAIE
ncbi:MAG: hypothetical protein OXK77_04055 [Gemmatimonadota bacterium]|nr:hypothetical protein [Gemmatimonadota bacterium]MDE2865445.1 hypothetical protein [Gemmatimonadota bacterium]